MLYFSWLEFIFKNVQVLNQNLPESINIMKWCAEKWKQKYSELRDSLK